MTDELLKQANELVNELWVYECTDCDFKSTGMGVIKHPRCPVCKGKNVCERGYISRLTIIKTLADELRASNETINRQHEMAQKQEKTIKTLSNELRQLESVVSEHNSFLKFTYKQVERGMFSDCMGAETALSNIAHQPESPFKNPKWNWDVSHLPYADAFHAKFPRE